MEEMRRHCADFHTVAAGQHELDRFWLRKTKKPVLSVLMVKKRGQPPRFYRGVNMEVCVCMLCVGGGMLGGGWGRQLSVERPSE